MDIIYIANVKANNSKEKKMEKIILYGLSKEREAHIKKLLDQEGFENSKFLHQDSAGYITGYLHDIDGYDESKHTPKKSAPEIEFMMISGFDGDKINHLVGAFRQNNIKRPITCSLTPTNVDWVFADLLNEVYEEHLFMSSQNK